MDLLLSRLFHDLIGPVSASRNGMELVREFGAEDVGAEAMDLVATSVEQAATRLTFFRMAFGGAGSAGGIGFVEARPVIADYLSHRKLEARIKIDGGVSVPPAGLIKIALGLVMVAAESLPKGGSVTFDAKTDAVVVSADGEGAALTGLTLEALTGKTDPHDEFTVVPATVGMNAQRFDMTVEIAQERPPEMVVRY